MPRGSKTLNGSASNGHVRNPSVSAVGHHEHLASVPSVQASEARLSEASLRFVQLLTRTDGWIRVIPAGEGKLSYFKYKYSSGTHKGKYVMFVAPGCDWTSGILGLWDKVDEVDRDSRTPAQDTFYDPR